MQHILGRPRYAVVSAEENLAEDMNRLPARRDAGEEAGVNEILAAIRDNVHRYREAGLKGRYWITTRSRDSLVFLAFVPFATMLNSNSGHKETRGVYA
jgi:hypothetical protein